KAIKQYCKDKKIINLDEILGNRLNSFVMRIEDALPQLQFSLPPHKQSQMVVLFFTKGKGEVRIGKTKVPITKQTLLIIPGQTINSGKHSEDTHGYVLIFNLKFFINENFPVHHLQRMNLFRAELIPYLYTGITQTRNLKAIFENIIDERRHERIKKNEMISLKILELLIICERLFKFDEKLTGGMMPLILIEFINLIKKHYTEHHSVTFYAQKLHVHPNTLNLLCKRHLLQAAKETIDLKLTREAESLLNNSTLSAKEIAYELGFQSATHFFRFFKRNTGNPPLQYRNLHLNM
ncbi:MAG: helix-turn-helix domain-containing protein, partial [Flavisolibacter sp.]